MGVWVLLDWGVGGTDAACTEQRTINCINRAAGVCPCCSWGILMTGGHITSHSLSFHLG